MNKEHSRQLMEEFPELWKHIEDLKSSLMAFGVACDDGWFSLIYQLCKDIMIEYNKQDDKFKKGFYVQQVKEKFGGLRFYISYGNKKIFELIDTAESESYNTCEVCGNPGKLMRNNGWYKTVCEECAKKAGYKEIEDYGIN